MDVEDLAVTRIQQMLARCSHLKQFIASNDKTPFIDGHIDLYGKSGQKKDDFLGRVSVQVKGRSRTGKRRTLPKFRVSRTDLLGFQRDGGVVYFLVDVDERGQCDPYYAVLSPFAIERYLRQPQTRQKNISVGFKVFPDKRAQIESIIEFALKTKSQRSSVGFDPSLIERMESITIHSTTELKLDEPLVLMPGESEFAVELTTRAGLTVPVDGGLRIVPEDYFPREREIVVGAGAGAVTYERGTVRRVNAESFELRFDEGLSLVITENANHRIFNVKFSLQSNFVARLRASEFLIGTTDTGKVEINGEEVLLGRATKEEVEMLTEFREHLDFLRQLRDLFERVGIDGHLVEFDQLTDDHIRNLQTLHRALVLGEELTNAEGDVARVLLRIGPWAVMVLVVHGESANKWRFVDPFNPEAPHMFRWAADGENDREPMPVTAYDIVEPADLPIVLNLQLNSILRAYEAIGDARETMGLANQRVLALLLAADSSNMRREEFLDAADVLNEWLISRDGETPVHLINRWQICWRRGALTPSDRQAIHALKRRMGPGQDRTAAEVELSCALLLGDPDETDLLITQMAEDVLRPFRAWPVWKLHSELRRAHAIEQ